MPKHTATCTHCRTAFRPHRLSWHVCPACQDEGHGVAPWGCEVCEQNAAHVASLRRYGCVWGVLIIVLVVLFLWLGFVVQQRKAFEALKTDRTYQVPR